MTLVYLATVVAFILERRGRAQLKEDLAYARTRAEAERAQRDVGLPHVARGCPKCSQTGKFVVVAELYSLPADGRELAVRTGYLAKCAACQSEFCTHETEHYRLVTPPAAPPSEDVPLQRGGGNA